MASAYATLKASRRKSLRALRTRTKPLQTQLHLLYREMSKRLEGHYTRVLGPDDAKKILEESQKFYNLVENWAKDVAALVDIFRYS